MIPSLATRRSLAARRRRTRPPAAAALVLVAPWRASVAAGSGVAGTLDPRTYREPADLEYWNCSTPPCDVPRLNSAGLTRESFDDRIMDGRVFIVEGLGRDWPMAKWDCDYFRSDPLFSQATIRQHYTQTGPQPKWVGFTSDWENANVKTDANDPDAPQVAPYYWGIKDVQHEDGDRSETWKAEMLEKVREHMHLPHFMDPKNEVFAKISPEFWFSPEGAGAKAHMDTHQETTMSIQLSGKKRWRIRFMDSRLAPCLGMTYMDGQAYRKKERWSPVFSFVLSPGDALFIPPGFIHETLGVEGCTASMTFQFDVPMASRLYRRFLPRVRRTADIHEVWLVIAKWATLNSVARGRALTIGKDYAAARKEALGSTGIGRAFLEADDDDDGRLTLSEIQGIFQHVQARSLLAFHDLDEDGRVSREEFAEVYAFWAGTTKDVVEATPAPWRELHYRDMITDSIEDVPNSVRLRMIKQFEQAEEALRQAERARAQGSGAEL